MFLEGLTELTHQQADHQASSEGAEGGRGLLITFFKKQLSLRYFMSIQLTHFKCAIQLIYGD